MRGYIPWKDWLLYGGLAILSVAGAVFAALTPQEWNVGMIVVLISVPLAFVTLAFIVLFSKYRSRPTFITKQGISVWTDDIPLLSKERFERQVEFFINQFLALTAMRLEKTAPEQLIDEADLRRMFRGSRVEWSRDLISKFSRWGWAVTDKAGLQQGKGIMVQWLNGIKDSALYHEWFHMIDEIVLKRGPDYKHEHKPWWGLILDLKRVASTRDDLN